ncbi:COG2426 family protein [Patescibacteria group bacterium]
MPAELITFLAAMLPFVEQKLAIPLGLELGLSIPTTFIFSVAGAIIPAAITLRIIDPFSKILRKRSKFMDKYLGKLFKKTQHQHTKKFERYGALILILFVAIPIPGSGTVGGSIIAFVFGVDYWKALTLLSIGACVAGFFLIAGFESLFALIGINN